MRIAFHAPLKSPDHPLPSGDRLVARLLVRALQAAGHQVEVASHLRTWDRGDPQRQQRLRRLGECQRARLRRRWARSPESRPRLWLTYHLYHKAPDWLGPELCADLGIPYVVAEASLAPARAEGPWASGHARVAATLGRIDGLINLNPEDLDCVRPRLRPDCRILELAPFIDPGQWRPPSNRSVLRAACARAAGLNPANHWLICTAMMREDVKRDSYAMLAAACERCQQTDWTLLVVGDGPARPWIERRFAALRDRVCFLGQLDPGALKPWLWSADLFVWPALGEAFGMAVLEAQAAGLPVLAGDRPGLRRILRPPDTGRLTPEGDVQAFATALSDLLADPVALRECGRRATAAIAARNSIGAASSAIDRLITDLGTP